ncbi:MAG: rhomboid family intramembrane serine protease [Alphaproteobacteria bacterium]|nr:rhomboid family intramembrane serine protease [Alphaproteobacteria bacterium]
MPNDLDDNVISFQPRPKQDGFGKDYGRPSVPPPMFNIPPVTKRLTGILISIHFIVFMFSNTFEPNAASIASYFGGFTPAAWSGEIPFYWWTPFSILTFSFLHSGWMHLGFNSVMLVAVGSGLEKTIGPKQYLMIYVGTTCFAVLAHFLLYSSSTIPIIGASGGISGIFGAMIVMMNQARSSVDKSRLTPMILAYIGISVLIGLVGAPDGASVAWVAHIGGFLSGVGFMMLLLKRRK